MALSLLCSCNVASDKTSSGPSGETGSHPTCDEPVLVGPLETATLPVCQETYEADYAIYSTEIEVRGDEDCEPQQGVEVEILAETQNLGFLPWGSDHEDCEEVSIPPTYVIGTTDESGLLPLFVLVDKASLDGEGQTFSIWLSTGGWSETVALEFSSVGALVNHLPSKNSGHPPVEGCAPAPWW